MARLPPAKPHGLATRLCLSMMRRVFGRDLKPYGIAAHSPRMVPGLTALNVIFETGKWSLEPALRKLVHLRVAQLVGCVF